MIKYDLIGYNNNLNLQTITYPLYVYLELTDYCNFKCKFCSNQTKNKKYMSLDLIKKILEELKRLNIYDIYYTGGEPLLHPKFEEIINYATKLGFRQTILTNGLLINKYEKILKDITCICISLHGNKKIHNYLTGTDCYDTIIKNILLAKKYTNIKINYTVTSQNQKLSEMMYILDFAKKNNINVSFSKYNNIGIGKRNNCEINLNKFIKNLDILIQKNYKFSINDCITPCLLDDRYTYLTQGCGAGYLYGSIDCDGNVKICPSSSIKLGNVTKKTFKKIWNNKNLKEYRKLNWIPIYCSSCKNLSKCRAGCKVELQNNHCEFNDYHVSIQKEETWNKIKEKKFNVNISLLRKEKDNYVNLSSPPRKFNDEAVEVIKLLNNGELPKNIPHAKELILSMYRDKLLVEEEENVKEKIEK